MDFLYHSGQVKGFYGNFFEKGVFFTGLMVGVVVFIDDYPVEFQSGSGLLEALVHHLIHDRHILVELFGRM